MPTNNQKQPSYGGFEFTEKTDRFNGRPISNPVGSTTMRRNPSGGEVRLGDRFLGKRKKIMPATTVEIVE